MFSRQNGRLQSGYSVLVDVVMNRVECHKTFTGFLPKYTDIFPKTCGKISITHVDWNLVFPEKASLDTCEKFPLFELQFTKWPLHFFKIFLSCDLQFTLQYLGYQIINGTTLNYPDYNAKLILKAWIQKRLLFCTFWAKTICQTP